MKIQLMSHSDLPEVVRIQRECYNDSILESVDSFSAKLSAAPDFCFIAVQDQQMVGYVVSLPWTFGAIPELDGTEYSVPTNTDSLCIHDLAVSPSARKAGAAKGLLDAALESAKQRGYQSIFLVAVQGASSYWQRHGFEVMQVDEATQRNLSAYGEDAVLMAKAAA